LRQSKIPRTNKIATKVPPIAAPAMAPPDSVLDVVEDCELGAGGIVVSDGPAIFDELVIFDGAVDSEPTAALVVWEFDVVPIKALIQSVFMVNEWKPRTRASEFSCCYRARTCLA